MDFKTKLYLDKIKERISLIEKKNTSENTISETDLTTTERKTILQNWQIFLAEEKSKYAEIGNKNRDNMFSKAENFLIKENEKLGKENPVDSESVQNELLTLLKDILCISGGETFQGLDIFKITEWYFLHMTDDPRIILSNWVIGILLRVYDFENEKTDTGIKFDTFLRDHFKEETASVKRIKDYEIKFRKVVGYLKGIYSAHLELKSLYCMKKVEIHQRMNIGSLKQFFSHFDQKSGTFDFLNIDKIIDNQLNRNGNPKVFSEWIYGKMLVYCNSGIKDTNSFSDYLKGAFEFVFRKNPDDTHHKNIELPITQIAFDDFEELATISDAFQERLFDSEKVLEEILQVRRLSGNIPLLGTYLYVDKLLNQNGTAKNLAALFVAATIRNHREISMYSRIGFYPGDDNIKRSSELFRNIRKQRFLQHSSMSTLNFLFQTTSEEKKKLIKNRDTLVTDLQKEYGEDSRIGIRVNLFDSLYFLSDVYEVMEAQTTEESFIRSRKAFAINFIKDMIMKEKAVEFIESIENLQSCLDNGANLMHYYQQHNPNILPVLLALMKDVYSNSECCFNDPLNYINALSINQDREKDYFTYLHLYHKTNANTELRNRFTYDSQYKALTINRNQITNIYLDFLFGKKVYAYIKDDIDTNVVNNPADLIDNSVTVIKDFNRAIPFFLKANVFTQFIMSELKASLYKDSFSKLVEDFWRMMDIIEYDTLDRLFHKQLEKYPFISQRIESDLALTNPNDVYQLTDIVKKEFDEKRIGKRTFSELFFLILLIKMRLSKKSSAFILKKSSNSTKISDEKLENDYNLFDQILINKYFDSKDDKYSNQLKSLVYYLLKAGISWHKEKSLFENFFYYIHNVFLREEHWSDEFTGKILLINTTIMNYKNEGFLETNNPEKDVEICKEIISNLSNLSTIIDNNRNISYLEKNKSFEFIDAYILYFVKLMEDLAVVISEEKKDVDEDGSDDDERKYINNEEELLRRANNVCEDFGIDKRKSGLFKWIESQNEKKYFVGKENRWILFMPLPVILGMFSVFGLSGLFNQGGESNVLFGVAETLPAFNIFLFAILSMVYIFSQIVKSKKIRISKALIRTVSLYSSFLIWAKVIVFLLSLSIMKIHHGLFVSISILFNLSSTHFLSGYTEWSMEKTEIDVNPKKTEELTNSYHTKVSYIIFLGLILLLLLMFNPQKAIISQYYTVINFILFLSLATQLFFTGTRMLLSVSYASARERKADKEKKTNKSELKLIEWIKEAINWLSSKDLFCYKVTNDFMQNLFFWTKPLVQYLAKIPVYDENHNGKNKLMNRCTIILLYFMTGMILVFSTLYCESSDIFTIVSVFFLLGVSKIIFKVKSEQFLYVCTLFSFIYINLANTNILFQIRELQLAFFILMIIGLIAILIQILKSTSKRKLLSIFVMLALFYLYSISIFNPEQLLSAKSFFSTILSVGILFLLTCIKLKTAFTVSDSSKRKALLSVLLSSAFSLLFFVLMYIFSGLGVYLGNQLLLFAVVASMSTLLIYNEKNIEIFFKNRNYRPVALNGIIGLIYTIACLLLKNINPLIIILFISFVQQSLANLFILFLSSESRLEPGKTRMRRFVETVTEFFKVNI